MAYSHPNLQRVGPSNSDSPTFWTYSTTDTAATLNTASYFDDASDDLTAGDLIYAITSTSGTTVAALYYVLTNASGVVDVNDGTVLAATDTD
jgi:hypothetical protein